MDYISNIFSSPLGIRDLVCSASLGVAAVGISLFIYAKVTGTGFCKKKCDKKGSVVNQSIKKGDSKVVDTFDLEDIGDKKVFCRCWRSASFPYCDGSHNKHNTETGDNVGPLIVGKKSN
ncbi:CDGSH iron-sulfur domain-containing protein 1-like isoform X1 [Daphnia pulex]|uniref:CDGSH iron-sulfur domain-containing protein 1-like isoform X1 n=1 Tax=Daphnia pulex TaxID=6669 RepID=UPI001EDD94AD|nr:CDGSH iron-sulfur domain-containing protein 1-like isoform X1 [Daphnia pulex]